MSIRKQNAVENSLKLTGEILLYIKLRDALKKYQGHPPKTKDISAELEILFAEKKDLYSGYKVSRDDSRKLQKAKRNVDMFLQLTTAPEDKQRKKTALVR